ncbi:MAG: YciI family protein [Kofleriaceae bacterium]
MKSFALVMILISGLISGVVSGCASRAPCPSAPTTAAAPTSAAPASAGTLEMKQYFLVLLRRGPAWSPEKTPETKKIFEGHMANIEAMARTGKLLIAGPTDQPETERTAVAGIFLFEGVERAEIEAMMKQDPAIAIGRLVPEVLVWYGPANITYPGKLIAPAAGEPASPVDH